MRIFFVTLIVTIRAMEKQSQDKVVTYDAGLRWPSLHQGLRPSVDNENAKLNVLGVSGSYSSLGHVITKKLEYASSVATFVLRQCFAETTTGKGTLAKSDFEVEILEVGALEHLLPQLFSLAKELNLSGNIRYLRTACCKPINSCLVSLRV